MFFAEVYVYRHCHISSLEPVKACSPFGVHITRNMEKHRAAVQIKAHKVA
jgi:hypothetical protein